MARFSRYAAGISRAYGALLGLFVAIACTIIALSFLGTLLDVAMRLAGRSSPQWLVGWNDYSLLFFTVLAAPYLLRHHAHVRLDMFASALPEKPRFFLERIVLALCIAISLVFAAYSLQLTWEAYQRGAMTVASVTLPQWPLYVSLPISFTLLAVEFARFLLGFASFDAPNGLPGPGH